MPTDGRYEVQIRYALPPNGDDPFTTVVTSRTSSGQFVDDVIAKFPTTAGGADYQTLTTELHLVQGENTIIVGSSEFITGLQLDQITIRSQP